jgi:hypothetical protein
VKKVLFYHWRYDVAMHCGGDEFAVAVDVVDYDAVDYDYYLRIMRAGILQPEDQLWVLVG